MVKTAGYTFGSRLIGALLSFALIVLISRWLGAGMRGICGLYLVVIATTTAISDIAGGATAPYLLRFFTAKKLLKMQMGWSVLPSALVPLVFVYFSGLSLPEYMLLVLTGWLYSTWSILQQLLLGLKKFRYFNLMSVAIPAFSMGIFAGLYFCGYRSSLTYLTSIGFSCLVACLSVFFMLKNVLIAPSIQQSAVDYRVILKKGLQNQSGHLVSILNSKLIFFILPATSLGLWSNTLSIGEAFFLIPGSLGQVAYGFLASHPGGEGGKGIFQKAWWANLLFLVPCLLVSAFLPESFWLWFFGESFAGISQMLDWAIPGFGLYSIYLLVSYFHSASGNFAYNFYALLAGFSVNLLISAWLKFTGNYSLSGGIISLVTGWTIASLAGLIALGRTNPQAFSAFFRLPPFK